MVASWLPLWFPVHPLEIELNTHVRKGWFLLGALIAAVSSANAATITESDPFSVGTLASGASTTQNLMFADFNSSLGTLTGVTVQYTVDNGAYAALEFINPFSNPSEAFSNGSVTGTLLTLANAADGVNLSTGAPFADVSVASGTILSTYYTVLAGASSTSPVTTSGSGTTADFIGAGTQTLALTLDGATSGATPGATPGAQRQGRQLSSWLSPCHAPPPDSGAEGNSNDGRQR